jgi:hypothetical protein
MLLESLIKNDVLDFLTCIQDSVHSVDELLEALREENQRVEEYGQHHINRLMELSSYQWQLEQVEMKLKAPSLIKISFTPEGEAPRKPITNEDRIEAFLLSLIMRFIRENGSCFREKVVEP